MHTVSLTACFPLFLYTSVEKLPLCSHMLHTLSCLPRELSGTGLLLQVLLTWNSGGRTTVDMQPAAISVGIPNPNQLPLCPFANFLSTLVILLIWPKLLGSRQLLFGLEQM